MDIFNLDFDNKVLLVLDLGLSVFYNEGCFDFIKTIGLQILELCFYLYVRSWRYPGSVSCYWTCRHLPFHLFHPVYKVFSDLLFFNKVHVSYCQKKLGKIKPIGNSVLYML